MIAGRSAGAVRAEEVIGRLLIVVTYVSVGLLLVGVGLLMADGVSPLSGGPTFELGRVAGDVLKLDPAGFLWLGLLAIMAAPVARVTIALVSYARDGDRLMVAVSTGILLVIAAAVASAAIATV